VILLAVNSIIQGVRAWLAACSLLSEFTKKYVDWTDDAPGNYGIFPDGDVEIGEPYINGTQERQYTVAVNAKKVSVTDAQRLANSAFLERLQSWIDAQFKAGSLPELPTGREVTGIEAANAMLLDITPNGKTGTYQVQINLYYNKTGG
jgi:hypothetical protein